ncbi:hypothetical protein SERLADRAFT_469144 [Serpula lacrymans var. lacrymans S7.9]|uniref:Pali-domain-containing protein n=1 Tax=Serpula lacrymans var. lacrymans (strain S7.9) TaxID=578457 RepID=F8NWM9_SERL9|nr:uncharacterized protein SERLADRAFT_469144 [Serpula lacrymans var. lacrymans S7.9]EGO25053.1 hypothetical protein SERLADRAFT_469144 [Serpula lacrymans var. lacrymans S7.9]
MDSSINARPIRIPNSLFPVFLLTLAAFVLLLFTTFSVPLISSFYFIDAGVPIGVRFGIWGWCYDSGGSCTSPLKIGYSFDPQIVEPLTIALVFYPISTILSLFATLSLIPLLCGIPARQYRFSVFSVLSLLSFFTSAIAFIFMIGLWGTAVTRFRNAHIDVSFGPLPWMSLAASIILLLVTISSGCGALYPRQ